MPVLISYYLGEEAVLPNVDTYDLEDSQALDFVLDNIDTMVVKPVAASGGYGILIGPQAERHELSRMKSVISEDPRGWVAQPVVQLSTCPTLMEDGSIASRHVDLRPFAVNSGDDVWVLPGGLTRVALVENSLVVNSSQGGGSKDTWVLTSTTEDHTGPITRPIVQSDNPDDEPVPREEGPNALPDLRLQQQEEQQQQLMVRSC
jgi:uncharacterized circularly permuted ATP-grasp superfamily protein